MPIIQTLTSGRSLTASATSLQRFNLTIAANVENLDASATGSSKLNLTGSTANNILTGNAANNILNGLAGADAMMGGAGDDTYVVDNVGDVVSEDADARLS